MRFARHLALSSVACCDLGCNRDLSSDAPQVRGSEQRRTHRRDSLQQAHTIANFADRVRTSFACASTRQQALAARSLPDHPARFTEANVLRPSGPMRLATDSDDRILLERFPG